MNLPDTRASRNSSWLRGAVAVARKDLLIERRSRVITAQVLPFAGIVVLLFAFALDPDRGVLRRVAPGLFWVATLLSALLMIARSYAVEPHDGIIRIGFEPAAVFFGKTIAVYLQLILLNVVMGVAMVALYDVSVREGAVLTASMLVVSLALAAMGVLFGAITAGERQSATMLPVLLLPALTPVMLAGTQSMDAGLAGAASDAWPWVGLAGLVAVIALSGGALAYEWLVER